MHCCVTNLLSEQLPHVGVPILGTSPHNACQKHIQVGILELQVPITMVATTFQALLLHHPFSSEKTMVCFRNIQ